MKSVTLQGKFKLVVAVVAPSVEIFRTQACSELAGGAVDGDDFLRFYDLGSAQQIGEIGVIGEGYYGIATVAIAGAGIERPSSHHGTARARDASDVGMA